MRQVRRLLRKKFVRRHGIFAAAAALLVIFIIILLAFAPSGEGGSRLHVPQIQPND